MRTLAKLLQRFSPTRIPVTSASLKHCLSRLLRPSPVSPGMEPMTVTRHTKLYDVIVLTLVLSFHRACVNSRTRNMAPRISVTGIARQSQTTAAGAGKPSPAMANAPKQKQQQDVTNLLLVTASTHANLPISKQRLPWLQRSQPEA